MKLEIYGLLPKKTIATMKFGTEMFALFQNAFITRSYIFIPIDIAVHTSKEEVIEEYGAGSMFIKVKREFSGKYSFYFFDIFAKYHFQLYPDYYEEIFLNSDSFITIDSKTINVNDINSEQNIYSEVELAEDIKLIEGILPISSLGLDDLKIKLDEAVTNQKFEDAAEYRDEIAKRE